MSINYKKGKLIANIFTPENKKIKSVYFDEEETGVDKVRINDDSYFFSLS